jgi:hypothetical protein
MGPWSTAKRGLVQLKNTVLKFKETDRISLLIMQANEDQIQGLLRFEVLAAVTIKITVFCDVTPRTLIRRY